MRISEILFRSACGENVFRKIRLLFQSSEMKLVRGFVKASKGVSLVLLLKEVILPHGGKKEKWFLWKRMENGDNPITPCASQVGWSLRNIRDGEKYIP